MQPQDIRIASLAEEANNIPTFAQRSILVGREYAIPIIGATTANFGNEPSIWFVLSIVETGQRCKILLENMVSISGC